MRFEETVFVIGTFQKEKSLLACHRCAPVTGSDAERQDVMAAMDAIYRNILARLQENAAQPVAEIARKVGLLVHHAGGEFSGLRKLG